MLSTRQALRVISAISLLYFASAAFAAANNYTYLALGESISFGYDPTLLGQPPNAYTGYPEIVADVLFQRNRKLEVNASCPGETSGSFITVGAPDYHCQDFKAAFGLKATYPGSQLNFAIQQLQTNKKISLVTLSMGGNDLILLEILCGGDPTLPSFAPCVQTNLPGVLDAFGKNMAFILSQLRSQGGYTGKLILMKQYVPNNDPLFTQAIAAMNQVMVGVGTAFGAKFADGFGAFQLASALYQGDPCSAGLLIRLSPTTCDVHPSPAGRDLLAATVLIALAQH
jgi:lysophospholipase L1-like esterase